jgi:polyhydroxyalkanoate synthesis regulator phasin
MNDLVERLRKRAEIRRQIPSRKSVQNNEPDRIADLLEEAANAIESLTVKTKTPLQEVREHWDKLKKECNGFCGEYECKENQANCKRIK